MNLITRKELCWELDRELYWGLCDELYGEVNWELCWEVRGSLGFPILTDFSHSKISRV